MHRDAGEALTEEPFDCAQDRLRHGCRSDEAVQQERSRRPFDSAQDRLRDERVRSITSSAPRINQLPSESAIKLA
jgi:hypothetical protein